MTSTTASNTKLTLHGYFRSSCSARLRIALYIKSLDFEYIPLNIKDGAHLTQSYAKINPSQSVPTLFIQGHDKPITQSIAALEFLDEAYPDTIPLLPKDPFARAQVRSLVGIIASDVQPVTNLRIMKALSGDPAKWSHDYHALGFEAFEQIISGTAGKFCVGDHLTMADVCLVPAVWNAERWGLDLTKFENLNRVYQNLRENEAVVKGHWKNQVDCPEDLRS